MTELTASGGPSGHTPPRLLLSVGARTAAVKRNGYVRTGMSDASDAAEDEHSDDEIAEIRERKREELLSDDTPGEPVHVESRAQFDELTGDDGVVMVDFHADWCGPCQMLEPIVEAVAETMPATVAKVDVDDHQAIAREFEVQGVPTLLFFVDGELEQRLVGVQDEVEIGNIIERYA